MLDRRMRWGGRLKGCARTPSRRSLRESHEDCPTMNTMAVGNASNPRPPCRRPRLLPPQSEAPARSPTMACASAIAARRPEPRSPVERRAWKAVVSIPERLGGGPVRMRNSHVEDADDRRYVAVPGEARVPMEDSGAMSAAVSSIVPISRASTMAWQTAEIVQCGRSCPPNGGGRCRETGGRAGTRALNVVETERRCRWRPSGWCGS